MDARSQLTLVDGMISGYDYDYDKYKVMYYHTPLPLNLASKQQATSNKQATSCKHFSFPFWPLLHLIARGPTLL